MESVNACLSILVYVPVPKWWKKVSTYHTTINDYKTKKQTNAKLMKLSPLDQLLFIMGSSKPAFDDFSICHPIYSQSHFNKN